MKMLRSTGALLAAAAIVLAASCVDRSPAAPRSRSTPSTRLLDLGGSSPGLLTCSPMAADSSSATIGQAGGSLSVGPHVLTIPAGALDSAVTITAVFSSDTVNRVQFAPAGLTFNTPASLSMSYANCGILGSLLPRQIAYTTEDLEILQLLGGVNDVLSQTVTAQIHHFSDYVVAW